MTSERTCRLILAGTMTAILALSTAVIVLADSSSNPPTESSAPVGSAVPAASGAPAASGGNAISIILKTFQPSTLTVHVGDTVTWTVTQAIADSHSVTSGSYKDPKPGTEFDSGIKLHNDGDSFSHTFAAAGTFPFFCAVHPDTMSGTITVVDATGSAGGGSEGASPTESKVIAGVVLLVLVVLLFGWARIYRRMNPGP
jgi:plastocyanin